MRKSGSAAAARSALGVWPNVANVPSRSRVMRVKFASVPAFRPIRTQVWVAAMQSAVTGLLSREPLVMSPIRSLAAWAASQIFA